MEPDHRLLYDLIVIVEVPARIRDRKNEYFHNRMDFQGGYEHGIGYESIDGK